MEKEKIIQIIDDLLQDCYNDLFEYENIEERKAKLIFKNVKLFTIKLKDRLEEENTLTIDHRTNAEKWQEILEKIKDLRERTDNK